MTCPNARDLELWAMEALEGEAAETLLLHAQSCGVCREQLESARRAHIDRVRMYETFDRGHDEFREQLMAVLPDEIPKPAGIGVIIRLRDRLGDLAMTLNTTTNRRLAAVLLPAACILLAVGLFLILGHGTVAFASVLERMRQARTMVCDTVMTARTEFSEVVVKEMERTQQEEGATPVPTEQTTRGKLSVYLDGTTQVWRLDQADPAFTQWIFPDHSVKIDAEGKRTVIRFAEQPAIPYARCESPEWWLGRLLKLTEAPDRELGTETLDGREVVGFEIAGWKMGYGARPTPGADATTAPTAVVRLWVDARTRLPVRMHVENVMAMRMAGVVSMRVSQTWEHIEWDVPLDPQLFEPPAPVAGELVEQREESLLGIPVPTEEALLDGLRAYPEQIKALLPERFADHLPQLMEQEWPDDPKAAQARAVLGDILGVLGHGYPQQLDASSFTSSMLKLSIVIPSLERARELVVRARGDAEALARLADERAAAAGNTEAAARLAERREAARKELDKKLKELGPSVMAMLVFYQQLLLEDREPEYFGATVKPGDSDAVLMRWKLDDQHMRVIYGDLRAETVAMDKQPNDAP